MDRGPDVRRRPAAAGVVTRGADRVRRRSSFATDGRPRHNGSMGPWRARGDRLGGDPVRRASARGGRAAGQAGAASRPRRRASRLRHAAAGRRRPASPPFNTAAAADARVHPPDARRDPLRRRPAAGLHLSRAPPRREDHRPRQGDRRPAAHLRGLSVQPAGTHLQAPVAVEGKPLPPAELARRDEEHRRNVLAEVERDKAETAGRPQRAPGQGSAGAARARRDRQRRLRDLRGARSSAATPSTARAR